MMQAARRMTKTRDLSYAYVPSTSSSTYLSLVYCDADMPLDIERTLN